MKTRNNLWYTFAGFLISAGIMEFAVNFFGMTSTAKIIVWSIFLGRISLRLQMAQQIRDANG